MSIFRRRNSTLAFLISVSLIYLPTVLSLQTSVAKKYSLVEKLIRLLDSLDSEQNTTLPSTREQETNKCDGLIETPYGGFINYPGMGLYENDLHCKWWIRAPTNSQVVRIRILSISIESRGRTCDCDKLEVFDVNEQNSTTLLTKFCGFRAPSQDLLTTESTALLQFTTDETVVYGGFLVYFTFVDREQKPVKESCSNTQVVLGIQGQINFPDSRLAADFFVCGWKIITPLGTQIQIKVNLPNNSTAQKTARCPEDVLVVRDGTQEELRCLCNDSASCTYPLSTNNTALVTLASPSSTASVDFGLKYRAISKDRKAYSRICEGQIMEMTGSGGIIQSPDYGFGNYPKNIRCTWTIKADPGKRIEFTVLDIDVEPDKTCQYDRLVIYDGCDWILPSSSPFVPCQTLGRFCGTGVPSPVSSLGPNATVAFETDASEERRGFRLKWRSFSDAVSIRSKPATDETTAACNGIPTELKQDQGVIASPKEQWSSNYPPSKECRWKIVMPAGMTVRLVFDRFSLEPPNDKACYDTLKICDGPDETYPSLGSFCGNNTPPVITSSSNQLFLLFVSDKSVSSTGFVARYSSVNVPMNLPITPAPAPPPRAMPRGKADVCGVQEVMPLVYTRIVGGVEAIAHSWPWMASIRYVPKSGEHWCGGAIIGAYWIVTAAHCCFYYGNASNFLVVVGDHNQAVVEGTEMTISVEKLYIHPSYDADTNDNDVAILKLSTDIPYGRTKKPVCLSKEKVPDGTLCVVTGWGDTRANGSSGKSSVLNQLHAPIINRSVCNQKGWYSGELTSTMICAGFPDGMKDSCQGDSGGPLIRQVDRRWCLVGVTSWGFDCAQPNHPGVYAMMALFVDWITSVTGIAAT